jgi:hypothetical protein
MSEFYDDNNNKKTICGSPMYMNLNKFNGIHDFASDFWSLKIIYFQMVYNIHPFKNAKNHKDIKLKLMNIKENRANSINYPYEYNPHTMLLKRLFQDEIKTAKELLNEVLKVEKEIDFYINTNINNNNNNNNNSDNSDNNSDNDNDNDNSSSINFINIDLPESTYDNQNTDSLFEFVLF